MKASDLPAPQSAISPLAFDYIRRLVRKESSIVLDDGKTYLVTSRLSPLARECRFESVAAFISHLQSSSRSTAACLRRTSSAFSNRGRISGSSRGSASPEHKHGNAMTARARSKDRGRRADGQAGWVDGNVYVLRFDVLVGILRGRLALPGPRLPGNALEHPAQWRQQEPTVLGRRTVPEDPFECCGQGRFAVTVTSHDARPVRPG